MIISKPTICNPTEGRKTFQLLGWYAFFGLLHELFHLCSFYFLNSYLHHPASSFRDVITAQSFKEVLENFLRALIGRYSLLRVDSEKDDASLSRVLFYSLHIGWILSLLVAIALHVAYKNYKNTSEKISSHACFAAYVTAIEAIATDLLGVVPYCGVDQNTTLFFCGNFGIVLINDLWIKADGGKTALDVLEKMVNVTMMRGAQCGGTVSFTGNDNTDGHPRLEGTLSRIVNAKRTDLSKGVRRKIEKDIMDVSGRIRGNPKGFFGHTRFATSSKATFDGCHPHRWSPKRTCRIYHPFNKKNATKTMKVNVGVENYITHNGDLDFYQVNGTNYALGTVQKWLEKATEAKMPSTVDSCAIAGIMDLLRTQGCFGLSARYAVCLGLPSSKIDSSTSLPSYKDYELVSDIFEKALDEMLAKRDVTTLDAISVSPKSRIEFAATVTKHIQQSLEKEKGQSMKLEKSHPFYSISQHIGDEESGCGWGKFVSVTVNAFFDNDLFHTMKEFLANAKGSFGLAMMSSLDAHRQFCIGARGQPMAVAFYPKKGLICYGSEQAAVKAGLAYVTPGGDTAPEKEDNEASRLDLDDLGGEICLLDWGYNGDTVPSISPPNRHLKVHTMMRNTVTMVSFQESKALQVNNDIEKRMTKLEGNEWIQPLKNETEDVILSDIIDIPRICESIQQDWKETKLNRLTAWNLMKCVTNRLEAIADGRLARNAGSVDILLTGCEVSLWMAEQFAADLQKCFPKLFIKSISSNKLLGLFGQELSIPCVGYPMSTKTHDLKDAIVIIVSHSGGTFAPLACSNMLQSFTRNIFVVASEWDTQIGKQLRSMHSDKELISSRIFVTGVGVRPAEPCSVSVAATHQLLTTLFIYICDIIIGEHRFRHASGAKVTEYDLKVLQTCNETNIAGLESIVGFDCFGLELTPDTGARHFQLRALGSLWANHILENAKAYVMTFIYIIVTVTIGYPLVTGIATAAGLNADWAFFLTRFLDSLIYFFLPQINVLIVRIFEGRNLRHRMVGRTVVIGDIPWVSQAAEAFLSKIFACSYSIAGLNVLSGNPADHLVHRHTHRVVRGSLLVCGRPDGRLSALTSSEATVCLSVNQASSIQSIGGTCESITIGHNPYKLPLSHAAVVLESYRPQFLCETVLDVIKESAKDDAETNGPNSLHSLIQTWFRKSCSRTSAFLSRSFRGHQRDLIDNMSFRSTGSITAGSNHDDDTSHHRLMGIYTDLQAVAGKDPTQPGKKSEGATFSSILEEMLKEANGIHCLRKLFDEFDADGSGEIDFNEFMLCIKKYDSGVDENIARMMFEEADVDHNGTLSFDEFSTISRAPQTELVSIMHVRNRTNRGLSIIKPTQEEYFGEDLRNSAPVNISSFNICKSQRLAMELYESRIASMQRFVAMTVMFHQMGKCVQEWFHRMTFGLMGYRMDRTHSIMRIATTASPVSGADVRERMKVLRMTTVIRQSVDKISRVWLERKEKREKKILRKVMQDEALLNRLLRESIIDIHMRDSLRDSLKSAAMGSSVRESLRSSLRKSVATIDAATVDEMSKSETLRQSIRSCLRRSMTKASLWKEAMRSSDTSSTPAPSSSHFVRQETTSTERSDSCLSKLNNDEISLCSDSIVEELQVGRFAEI